MLVARQVGKCTSIVLCAPAGGVVWDGRGDYWLPETWQTAADLACGADAATPGETFADISGCGASAFSADDALDVALRTNLAATFAARGAFSAYTYLYTPTVGACDPGTAEYVVVLSQRP